MTHLEGQLKLKYGLLHITELLGIVMVLKLCKKMSLVFASQGSFIKDFHSLC